MNNINENKIGILITGINEYIGRNLICQLIKKTTYRLFCFDFGSFGEKDNLMNDLLKTAENYGLSSEEIKNRVMLVTGTIGKPLLGISDSQLAILKEYTILRIAHTSHIIKYYEIFTDLLAEYNIQLTNQLLEVATLLNVDEIDYITNSFNSLNDDKILRQNIYIESQKKAEQLLIKNCESNKISLRIFRFPIVVDRHISCICFMSDFLEQIIWFFDYIKDRENEYFTYQQLTIYIKQSMTFNIIPVDLMVKEIIRVWKTPSKSIEIYDISNSSPISISTLAVMIKKNFSDLNVHYTDNLSLLNPVDKLLFDKIAHYYQYFSDDSHIASHRDVPNIKKELEYPADEIIQLVSQLILAKVQEKDRMDSRTDNVLQQMKKTTIKCRYNLNLEYYSIGKGPVIVIENAIGPTISLWKWLVSELSKDFKVFVWEPRGLRGEISNELSSNQVFGYEERARDIKEILDYEKIENCHVIAFCVGTKDALAFYRENPERVKSLILINGEYTKEVDQTSAFSDDFKDMVTTLKKAPQLAKIFIRILTKVSRIQVNTTTITDAELEKMINLINPKFVKIIKHGLMDENGILNFAQKYDNDKSFDCNSYVHEIKVPTLVVNAPYDAVVNPEQSKWLYDNIKGAKYIEIFAATHYIPFENWKELTDVVRYFIRNNFN